MPLVVPGITNKSSGSSEDWQSKLMGKTLGESSDTTTFAKQDLPKEHRVIGPDSMSTMDHNPERLNVHVDEKGVVKDVRYG
jgi:hypothetical protein